MTQHPQHIAIIMDGNGRWAKSRFMPRIYGHKSGVKCAKDAVSYCRANNIKYLTLFAFGRDNRKRPNDEVDYLTNLLLEHLDAESPSLNKQNVKVRVLGDKTHLNTNHIELIDHITMLTKQNTMLHLNIAFDYSGRYDIMQAVNRIITDKVAHIDETKFNSYLLFYPDPHPDLLIRTGGEMRISNFMLWQLAYSELYFTEKAWPEFTQRDIELAIEWFKQRTRRFGMINEQLGYA